jgi:hypothetical protein
MKEASRHKTVRIRNFKNSRQLIDESMPVKEGETNKQKGRRIHLIENKQRYTASQREINEHACLAEGEQ